MSNNISAFFTNALIDTAAARLAPKNPAIHHQAEELKEAVKEAASTIPKHNVKTAPLYEALIAKPALAKKFKVTISSCKNDADPTIQKDFVTQAIERNKHKDGVPMFIYNGMNDIHVFEFADGPNLVREVTQIYFEHHQRASIDPGLN